MTTTTTTTTMIRMMMIETIASGYSTENQMISYRLYFAY